MKTASEAVLDLIAQLNRTAQALTVFSRDVLTLVYPAAVALDNEVETLVGLGNMQAFCNQIRLELPSLELDEVARSAVQANYDSLIAGGDNVAIIGAHVVRALAKGNRRSKKLAVALAHLLNKMPQTEPATFEPPKPVKDTPVPVVEILPPVPIEAGAKDVTETGTVEPAPSGEKRKPGRPRKAAAPSAEPEPPKALPADTFCAAYESSKWPVWKTKVKTAGCLIAYPKLLTPAVLEHLSTVFKNSKMPINVPATHAERVAYLDTLNGYKKDLKPVWDELQKLVTAVKEQGDDSAGSQQSSTNVPK